MPAVTGRKGDALRAYASERKPSCAGIDVAKGTIKPNRIGEPEAGQGTEGGRFTDSTDDSGPMKPGNRVEDKTLTTGKTGWRKNV
jgi:hypothetical protein